MYKTACIHSLSLSRCLSASLSAFLSIEVENENASMMCVRTPRMKEFDGFPHITRLEPGIGDQRNVFARADDRTGDGGLRSSNTHKGLYRKKRVTRVIEANV